MARKPKRAESEDRCTQETADGRRCRMPRMNQQSSLCRQHWQRQQELLCDGRADALGVELLGPFQEFTTARAINHVLGKAFALLAKDRIPARTAAVLAYLGKVLLHSVELMRKETLRGEENATWKQLLHHCPRPQRPGPAKSTGEATVTPDEEDAQKSPVNA